MTVRQAMRYEEITLGSLDSYVGNDDWVMEQKMDGTRVLAVITDTTVTYLQRDGKPLGHTAATQHLDKLTPVLRRIVGFTPGEVVVDGELMIESGEYRLFDAPYMRFGGVEVIRPSDALLVRREALEAALAEINLAGTDHTVSVVKQARTWREKKALWEEVNAAGVEGVMVKHVLSTYDPGQRVKHTLKVKLVKSADVVVTAVNRSRNAAGRETGSISFGVHEGGHVYRTIGKCSAIGKPEVESGDVIEVAYLYWTGTTTYQPRMLRVRTDKSPTECTIDQFAAYSRKAV